MTKKTKTPRETATRNQYKNEELDRYCTTDNERATFRALVDCGGDYAAMAVSLGMPQSNVRNRLHKLRKKAALRGWSPTQDVKRPTMAGFSVKRISSYAKPTGPNGAMEVTGQWMIQDRDAQDRMEAMRIACDAMAEPLRGKIEPVAAPKAPLEEDLMVAYYIGDHHLGMYSWAAETGVDYDCDIAETILDQAFQRMGAAAPAAQKALVVSIGDFFHADNHKSVTPHSGNVLDTDSRHSRVIQTGIRMLRRAIDFALRKHAEVEVLIIAGNHDPESSIWLAHCMAVAYDSEPRVTVRTDPRVYKYTRWGKCLIGTTHGHRAKAKDLPAIMAVDVPQWWGETTHREFVHGHFHHESVKAERGCTVHCISVLAAADAWHAGEGYRSDRGMELAVYHKSQGRLMTLHGTVEYITA